MKRYVDFLKKVNCIRKANNPTCIVVYGGGANGKIIEKLLMENNIKVDYLVDSRANISDEARNVYSPNRLKEEKGSVLVIVSPHHIPYILEIDKKLEENGFKKNENYINFIQDQVIEENKKTYYFDPFLGINVLSDIEGFKISGNAESKNRIMILGNCTSTQSENTISWVDYLFDKIKCCGGRLRYF